MRSAVGDVLPLKLRRGMKKFGADIGVARRKRFLTVTMLSERVGIAESTYLRAERGDPTVAFGVYAMILFVLGFGDAFADLIDVRKDDQGLLFDAERLPKRIRAKKRPTSS